MKRTTFVVLVITGLVALAASAAFDGRAIAQVSYKVGLVVQFSDQSVFTDCVEFSDPNITGEDVLDRSGLSIAKEIYPGLGAAICKIKDDGCNYPQQNCFCQCTGEPPCQYWAYYYLDQQQGEWVYSGMGASWREVQPGDVEGWSWGAGDPGGSEVEPPVLTFEELCSPPTPTPTKTPKPVPPVVDFWADPEEVPAGQCTTLRWSVMNGEIVVLDGEGVRPDDARYLCPQDTHTYGLEVLNAAGEFYYEVTIIVRQLAATPTASPTSTPGVASSPRPSTQTPTPHQPGPLPSPTPTETLTPTPTPEPAIIAMAATPTTALQEEQPREPTPDSSSPEAPEATAAPEVTSEEPVGVERILLLLGVGAGTLGFGTVVFVGMLLLLVLVYFRARAHF